MSLKAVSETRSNQAHKVLFETKDGHRLETVRMVFRPSKEREKEHVSLCISSQSGCALGCKFCSTGAIGFKKNLTANEIVDQVRYFQQKGLKTGNISFMGMGEPFENAENVFKALDILTDPQRMAIGSRHISISTVGIVPGIQRLTLQYPQVNLAYSLHSPFPKQRLSIMPITRKYPINEVMNALDAHLSKTKRRVFLVYVLLKYFNDTIKHAEALVDLIKARRYSYLYHINLLRFNAGLLDSRFERSSTQRIKKFRGALKKMGMKHTLRQSFGLGINAACGQLCAGYTSASAR